MRKIVAKGDMSLARFFWKIVYDENSKRGIAVVGTNNIHRSGIDNRPGTLWNYTGLSRHFVSPLLM